MRFVAPPTHVGEDRWPVLSAVRVSTADDPAEFIVIIDCGEGTPVHPYATLQVYVWPKRRTRRRTGDVEYNLTFDQARRSLAERAGLLPTSVEVVVVHGPDGTNEFAAFADGALRDGIQVVTHHIDLGTVTPAVVERELHRAEALSTFAERHARDALFTAVLAFAEKNGLGTETADSEQVRSVGEPGDTAAGPEFRAGTT